MQNFSGLASDFAPAFAEQQPVVTEDAASAAVEIKFLREIWFIEETVSLLLLMYSLLSRQVGYSLYLDGLIRYHKNILCVNLKPSEAFSAKGGSLHA
jgi:hypothetical protein